MPPSVDVNDISKEEALDWLDTVETNIKALTFFLDLDDEMLTRLRELVEDYWYE